MPFVLNEAVRAVRTLRRGPATGAPIRLVMTGGDNVDNAQYNETRWFIDVLDGGARDPELRPPRTCGLKRHPATAGCAAAAGSTSRMEAATGPATGLHGGQPPRRRRSVASRDYPGLFEQMNRPFRAVGLGIPWYSVFGNHDGLVQGNFAQNGLFDQIVVGCRKVTRYSREALVRIRPLLAGGVTPQSASRSFGSRSATTSTPGACRASTGASGRRCRAIPARRFLNAARGCASTSALAARRAATASPRPTSQRRSLLLLRPRAPASASSRSTPSRITRARGISTMRSSAGSRRSWRPQRPPRARPPLRSPLDQDDERARVIRHPARP